MNKMKVSFSTNIGEEGLFRTAIDLVEQTIEVSNEDEVFFKGSLAEFKALVIEECKLEERVYKSLLNMTELLEDTLTKK